MVGQTPKVHLVYAVVMLLLMRCPTGGMTGEGGVLKMDERETSPQSRSSGCCRSGPGAVLSTAAHR